MKRVGFLAVLALLLSACGGGGGGDSSPPPPSTPPPSPPPPPSPSAFTANDDSAEIEANASTSIAVLENDEYSGESPTVSIVDAPARGEASTDGTEITYTPRQDYAGADSVRYRITGSDDRTSEATVRIDVSPGDRVGVSGTVHGGGDAAPVLAAAECSFDALNGEALATATADDDGLFFMLAPPDSNGHVACSPPDLPDSGLLAFLATGSAGDLIGGHEVTPRATAIATLLAMELARDPDMDPAARAGPLAGELAGDAHFGVLTDAAEGLFGELRSGSVNTPFFDLLIDAFGNSRIDNAGLSASAADLDDAIRAAEDRGDMRVFAAATRKFADLALLAWTRGIDDPAPPPPLAPDPSGLDGEAEDFRTMEFARNPSLSDMNAHWAYARGLTGQGELVGMTDTGLYAAHQEFSQRLHEETVYTVIADDADGDGDPDYRYPKVADQSPDSAYAPAQPDPDNRCSGVFCKFYQYQHGSLTASLALGARNGNDAHGVAFDARLVFWPFRQTGSTIGASYYNPPGDDSGPGITYHGGVRRTGDLAPIVSNSWLTASSRFTHDLGPPYYPFHRVLTPRYSRYQRDRNATDRAVLLWAAGNVPLAGGPLTDGSAVPSITERQARAASGGATGLADLLLTDEERSGLSDREALRRAEQAMASLKRRWLTVAALADRKDSPARRQERVQCAALTGGGSGACDPIHTLGASARCGFASDWCVAAGLTWGGVFTHLVNPPQTAGSYFIDAYRTSEASASAAGALAVLLQAYRGADGQLAVGTDTALKRLKATARRDVFSAMFQHDPELLVLEQDMIRALVGFAEATDDELRALIDAARTELNALLPGIPDEQLTQEETRRGLRVEFSLAQKALIESARASLDDDQWARFRVLNRLVYQSSFREEIDTFPPQLFRVRELLNDAGESDAKGNDLLAQLIRQVEWIDEQLRRLGRTRFTVTDEEIRQITVISMIGHGFIDLKAATDPAG